MAAQASDTLQKLKRKNAHDFKVKKGLKPAVS